jgi:hypothetical protein
MASKALRAGAALTLGAVTTPAQWRAGALAAAALALLLGGARAKAAFGDARKRRAYKKALAEVEKMK